MNSPKLSRAPIVGSFWLGLALSLTLRLTACHHTPRTSAELHKQLPRQFTGEVNVQGQMAVSRLRITPHNFTERSPEVLEFNSVQYALMDAQGALLAEGDASIRGTITLPGLEVRLESIGDLSNGEEMVKSDTFKGKLSADLQSAEADWTSSLGQRAHLKVVAVK